MQTGRRSACHVLVQLVEERERHRGWVLHFRRDVRQLRSLLSTHQPGSVQEFHFMERPQQLFSFHERVSVSNQNVTIRSANIFPWLDGKDSRPTWPKVSQITTIRSTGTLYGPLHWNKCTRWSRFPCSAISRAVNDFRATGRILNRTQSNYLSSLILPELIVWIRSTTIELLPLHFEYTLEYLCIITTVDFADIMYRSYQLLVFKETASGSDHGCHVFSAFLICLCYNRSATRCEWRTAACIGSKRLRIWYDVTVERRISSWCSLDNWDEQFTFGNGSTGAESRFRTALSSRYSTARDVR